MGIKRAEFVVALDRLSRVGLDSSILIYHLEDMIPYAELTEVAFAALGEGSLTAVLSTISVTELLVRPFAEDRAERIAIFERFVLSLPNTTLISPGYATAKVAARLRAKYNIRTPDALLVATALEEQAAAFLTNDSRLRRLQAEGITIVILDDYIEPA